MYDTKNVDLDQPWPVRVDREQHSVKGGLGRLDWLGWSLEREGRNTGLHRGRRSGDAAGRGAWPVVLGDALVAVLWPTEVHVSEE